MTSYSLLKDKLGDVLTSLTERERKVLELRFGLTDGYSRTLEEVGKQFKVTRERIRQIETKALRKYVTPRACANCRASLTAKASTASVLANWPNHHTIKNKNPADRRGFLLWQATQTAPALLFGKCLHTRALHCGLRSPHVVDAADRRPEFVIPQPRCRKTARSRS